MVKPVISVLVPIYNQEKYIEECLRSLFTQSSEAVEYILVNDGSTDNSAALCRQMMAEYPVRARLIDQENHGLLKTRQIALMASEGAYIVSVDSDDCLLEGAIPTLLDAIERERPDVILYNATSDPEGRTPIFSYPFPSGTRFAGEEEKYTLYKLLCATDKLNNIWAKCVRRELLLDEEVYADIEGISNGEDLYQSLVLLDRAETVLFLDKVLYYWRKTVGSMSRRYNPNFFRSEKKVCLRRIAYAEKWSKGSDELVVGAKVWICRILRDVTRKAFISDMPWDKIRAEIEKLRADTFYRAYYFDTDIDPNKRDLVLKSAFPVMRAMKAAYALKPRR